MPMTAIRLLALSASLFLVHGETCADENPSYTDALGYSCSSWQGYDCSEAYYTAAQVADLKYNCPICCGISPPSPTDDDDDSPPSPAPAAESLCDVVNPYLSSGLCTCKETTGGSGLRLDCSEKMPLNIGNVGVRLDIEPCKNPAYIQASYEFGDVWQTVEEVKADGERHTFPIPDASVSLGTETAGLLIAVTVSGDAEDLSVRVQLSLCIPDECDGDISYVGYIVKDAGFPFTLVEFDHQKFESCPASSSSTWLSIASNTVVIAVAAAAAVLILAVVIGVVVYCKKRRCKRAGLADAEAQMVANPNKM